MRKKAQENNWKCRVLVHPRGIGIPAVPSLPKAVKRVRLPYPAFPHIVRLNSIHLSN